MLGERAILDEVAGGEVALQRPRVEPIGIAIVGPQCRLAAGLEEFPPRALESPEADGGGLDGRGPRLARGTRGERGLLTLSR